MDEVWNGGGSKTQRKANTVNKIVKEMLFIHPNQNKKVSIHLFSNGGGICYMYMTRLWEVNHDNADIKEYVKGMIWDSSPGDNHLDCASKACEQALGKGKLTTILYLAWLKVIFKWWKKSEKASEFWNFVRYEDPLKVPYVYIYSDKDDIILREDVEKVIEIKKKNKQKVTAIRLGESDHVKHIAKYPTEYTQAVRDHVLAIEQQK
jgi:hypothetical protein